MRIFLRTILLSLLALNPLWADDIEIFFNTAGSGTQPNLLFVLDGSGSMAWYDCLNGDVLTGPCNDGSPNGDTSRLTRMVNALSEVLDNTSGVNVGFMRFSHWQAGGRVIYPMRPIDAQFCNGEPCDADSLFTAQSVISSADDDLYEDNTGTVDSDDVVIPLTTYDGDQQSIATALRFTNLKVPQGSTIEEARIIFKSASDSTLNSDLQFKVEDTHDSAAFEQGTDKITSRTWSADTIGWNNVDPWTVDETYQSPDLAPLVNDIVNRTDWCGGNSLSFAVEGTGDRLASAFERGDQGAPILKVTFRQNNIPDTGGCILATARGEIESSRSDARQITTGFYNGTMGTYQNSLYVAGNFMSGLSFTGVDIPQGAKIRSATVKLHLRPTNNIGTQITNISVETNANPTVFIPWDNYNLSDRPTTQSIPWADDAADLAVLQKTTPDIASLVQTAIDNPAWLPGNRINVILEKASGNSTRSFTSWDSDREKSARLEIVYEGDITTESNTIGGPLTDVRTELLNELNNFKASDGTPTVGALLEARRYFAGLPMNYGKDRDDGTPDVDNTDRYSRVSTRDSFTGGVIERPDGCDIIDLNSQHCAGEYVSGDPVYISPMEHECQSNHVIVLTDGEPNANIVAKTEAQQLVGGTCAYTNGYEGGLCGVEVAGYLKGDDEDQNQGDADDPHDLRPDIPGRQNLTVHTIGFNLDNQWLDDIAADGGGIYRTADSALELIDAVNSIVSEVKKVDTTFVAPGATVDQFSRLSHRKDIYLALFQPSRKPGWKGNLKKFEIKGSPPAIFDSNNKPAVDTVSGKFKGTSRSFWSATDDGNNSLIGGAAALLDPDDRNIVTYFTGNQPELLATNNLVIQDNITPTLLNAADDAERDKMLDWLYGIDVLDEDEDEDITDFRNHLGDPLHSRPLLITYGGTQADPDSMLVFGTNDGFLHALNTRDGTEEFAFIPEPLFANLKTLYDNNSVAPTDSRIYGMDGDLTLWTQDNNANSIIEDGDKAYLYAGMRRGGRDYYVLDLSTREAPKFKAQINGGVGDFVELGQTWSKPRAAKLDINGTIVNAMIFAGGYDSSQDTKDLRAEDTMGRAIYIVDAENPNTILWSGTGNQVAANNTNNEYFDKMRYSIPSDVVVVNEGRSNLASQIYVGDMGGQVWRFDINNGAEAGAGLVDGGVIADLAMDGVTNGTRRFYSAPDLSLDAERNLNIAIGSGYEAHPLNKEIRDSFFVFSYPFDATGNYGIKVPASNPAEYTPIKITDLYDATDNVIGQGTTDVEIANARMALEASQGWHIRMLRPGEKILGASTTLNSVVRFISYVPEYGAFDGCEPNIGTSFYWTVNLSDATPPEQDNTTDLKAENRYEEIATPGIAPPVQVIFTSSDGDPDNNIPASVTPTDVSGINVLNEGDSENPVSRWYWSEEPE